MSRTNTQKVNLPCECCKHPEMKETYYSDINDSYLFECTICQHEEWLHFTAYDALSGDFDVVNNDLVSFNAFSHIPTPKRTETFDQRINRLYKSLVG
jgi:hypothetical protein